MPKATLRAVAPVAARKGTSTLVRCMSPVLFLSVLVCFEGRYVSISNQYVTLLCATAGSLDEYYRDTKIAKKEGFRARLAHHLIRGPSCQGSNILAAPRSTCQLNDKACMHGGLRPKFSPGFIPHPNASNVLEISAAYVTRGPGNSTSRKCLRRRFPYEAAHLFGLAL